MIAVLQYLRGCPKEGRGVNLFSKVPERMESEQIEKQPRMHGGGLEDLQGPFQRRCFLWLLEMSPAARRPRPNPPLARFGNRQQRQQLFAGPSPLRPRPSCSPDALGALPFRTTTGGGDRRSTPRPDCCYGPEDSPAPQHPRGVGQSQLKETPWRKRTGDLGGGGDLPQLTELGTSLCGGFPAGGCEGRPDCGAAPGSSAPRPMGRREPCLPAPIKGSGWRWGAEAAPMEWRRWSTGLSAAVLLMLQGLAFAQGLSCNRTEYQLNGRCCSRCPPGQKVATACSGQLNTSCIPCEEDHFQASWTKEFHCTQHRTCKQKAGLTVYQNGTKEQDFICRCREGTHCSSP
uniref:Tumor necrosis factor receptor superfamily member 5 n=1 Tax=Naja naja TaxID=35670 RepID=A0A8C6XZL6_NAJNA